MNTNGGLRAVTAREIRDNLELFLSLAEQGKVFVCDDAVGSLPDSLCTPSSSPICGGVPKARQQGRHRQLGGG